MASEMIVEAVIYDLDGGIEAGGRSEHGPSGLLDL
jgi:hypothetical protein